MKRYEDETDEMSTWTWHNREFVTDDVLEWAHEKIQALEAQLTWRDASETPKDGQRVFLKKGENFCNGYFINGSFMDIANGYKILSDGAKYLPIPKE